MRVRIRIQGGHLNADPCGSGSETLIFWIRKGSLIDKKNKVPVPPVKYMPMIFILLTYKYRYRTYVLAKTKNTPQLEILILI